MERNLDATSAETVALPAGAPGPSAPASVPRLTSSSTAEEGRFLPGTLLGGRYRIIGLLGQGGMGEVYRATDLTLGQSVALKFLPESASGNEHLLERFHIEVRIARQVSHPNVCRVYDIGEAEGLPFISMEYVDGEDLGTLLRRVGRLPSERALETARGICAGLAAAHAQGVIHRDLKPQNIMMNKRGEIMIMDFGLSAIAGHVTGTETRSGTPLYMSPEQLKGIEVTARSDIYALGLVLYELFTGRRPYDADNIQRLIEQQESAHVTPMSSIAADIDPAVEKAIRRCLDPDPNKRPATALSVSAALPGGDPLAAALAAGETPSPDLVAAAGKTEGLALRYSLPCLAIVLLCLAISPTLKQKKVAFYQATLDFPPQVLLQKAREIAAALGYPRKPNDSALWLVQRLSLLTYLNLMPPPRNWNEWLSVEAPVSAFYRESLQPMVANPVGNISRLNPAPVEPGMVGMELDGAGRLRDFSAIPYPSGFELAQSIPPEAVFRAAQFDMNTFREVTANHVPPNAADEIHAWKGPHPKIAHTELTVEIASWKGRITSAKFIYPWMTETGSKQNSPSLINNAHAIVLPYLVCGGLIFAILLTRHNWKLGRFDRRGAVQLAVVEFVLSLLIWAGTVHAAPAMFDLFFNALAIALYYAAIPVLLYLALEPALRARWPHSIVTWNRVLAGRWRDAQVGSHVLIGAAVGMAIMTLIDLRGILVASQEGLDTTGGLFLLNGTRQWIAGILSRAGEALRTGLLGFFGIFLLRTVLRKDWIAAIAGALVFAAIQAGQETSVNWPAQLAVYVGLFAVLIFVLLRFGLIAIISAVFFLNALNSATLGTDWTTWYAPAGFATSAVILGIALFAFKQSLGNRDLIGSTGE